MSSSSFQRNVSSRVDVSARISPALVCARIYIRNHVPRDLGMDIYPCVYLDGDAGVSLD